MATSVHLPLLALFIFADSLAGCLGFGINYGQIANNLPTPSRASYLVQSLNVTRVKLYDADPNVLRAFAGSRVEFVIGLGNEYLQQMSDPAQAQSWVKTHVQPYVPSTKIRCITVGNELLAGGGNNSSTAELVPYLLPAMQSVHAALVSLGIDGDIYVTTAHQFGILGSSYPPSAGAFRADLAEQIRGVLSFHSQTKSPFLINAYPFFAYKDDPGEVSLPYVLFQPNQGTVDAGTGLRYDNMLYAQIDAVYHAIQAMGYGDIEVKVSETGWPSKGDAAEVGASPENAQMYNGNLLSRIQQREGTPLKPSVPVDIFVFALFNENLKPGPTSERNYGLFYPDGTPVYNIGLQGYLPRMDYSGSANDILFKDPKQFLQSKISKAFILFFICDRREFVTYSRRGGPKNNGPSKTFNGAEGQAQE